MDPSTQITELLTNLRVVIDKMRSLRASGDFRQAAHIFEEANAAALSGFSEYVTHFRNVWAHFDPVLSQYNRWKWYRADRQVDCTWGTNGRASMTLLNVGLIVAVEVATP